MTGTPITLTTEDADKLLNELKHERGSEKKYNQGIRNHCMALLMLDAGLRVGEVVHLNIEDLYFMNEPVYQLRISELIAKNKTERLVPLSQRIRTSCQAMYNRIWSNQPPFVPAFFHEYKKGYRILTTRQVERITRKAAMISLGRPVHPHVLRHTFASRLMRTTNSRVVQELLGHQHMSTTQIYMHPNQEDKKKAIQSLDQNQP
ncbi:unnamed protein product, partial [marine sediment metagenome]